MNEINDNLPYRRGVGGMILNSQKEVFIAKRINAKVESWQMPQGGIDENEDPKNAIFREIYEEIGTDKISIIKESKEWFKYDIPKRFTSKFWEGKYRGQQQKWYLLKFEGTDSDVNLTLHVPEFSEWRWIKVSQLVHIVVAFKKKLYEEILLEFKDYL